MVKIISNTHAGYGFLTMACILFSHCSIGQRLIDVFNFKSRSEVNNPLYKVNHWDFVIAPNVTQKAQISHMPNAIYRLQSAPQISGEFGVSRVTHLNESVSFQVGLRLGITGRNGYYIAPYREVGYDKPGEYAFTGPLAREYDVSYFSLPLQLEYRWFLQPKSALFLSGGLSVRAAPLNGSSNGDMDIMEIRIKGNNKPFVNFNTGAGYAFLLRNLDILKTGFNINYDPSHIATGQFYLTTNSSNDEGAYTVKGSSVGIYIVYSRTKAKKKIEQEYR